MDYEQKYKNLVERLMKAKEDYDIADERYCCVIDGLIPEPQESEDERIRKWLIDDVKDTISTGNMPKEYEHMAKSAISWLEKQTNGLIWHKVKSGEYVLEPTLIIKKNGEYELVKDACLSLVDAEYALPLSWVKRQGSQNLANSEKTCKDEQNPAWSKEDEENLNWFEKFFRAESVVAEGKDIPQDRYLWFKNLKERYTWKPSEQQIGDLEYIMKHYPNIRGMVNSIYTDLKKLK